MTYSFIRKERKKEIAIHNVKSITHVTSSFDLTEHLSDKCDPMRWGTGEAVRNVNSKLH